MIIAVDGPAGAGKSTVARIIAQKLGFLYIDTGAMYRAITLKSLEKNIGAADEAKLIEMARSTDIGLVNSADGPLKIFLDGRDASRLIREPRITRLVSDIAKIRGIREIMLGLQRKLGRQRDSVLDGRDIGTVVFPDADRKFFIDADFKERVRRRHKELIEAGQGVSEKDVEEDLRNRDKIDSTREFAPLKKAEDAIRVDTTNLTIDEVVEKVLSYING
ncbi:MAG: (d)CMP kinase [Candidatus Omnitrophica bacterium]|nr:(d)CMP kinase [Candidatus Omnitrophota bacterium]MDD5553570.1 (d)CMP kinase [Candidatus Omnitrophota bacterium]